MVPWDKRVLAVNFICDIQPGVRDERLQEDVWIVTPKGEFEGKVAVVTGAAQGMGRAAAERLAKQGAETVLVDIQLDRALTVCAELARNGLKTRALACDVSDEDQVRKLVETILGELGHIDILVNCAGILRPTPFDELSTTEWDRVMSVNLRGTFLMMRMIYPNMKERRYGRIVNFSSTAGLTVSTLGGAHYTASKHGVMGLTKAVAKEGAPFGIRVNAVCPGLIDTEMVQGSISPERIRRYENSFPIARLGTVEEVADLVYFLVSDRSAYITGVGVNISGGDLL